LTNTGFQTAYNPEPKLEIREVEFGEMKRDTSNWSNFCMLLHRAGLSASAGLSCSALTVNISKTVADTSKVTINY